MIRVAAISCALVAAVCAAACSSSSEDGPTGAPCADVNVDRFKELMIVEPAVLDDARAKNATGGVWSFRHAVENMTPPGADTSEFVRSWLLHWVEATYINGYALDEPGELRDAAMNDLIICPWLKRTPANGCDEKCGTCTSKHLDLALAPFRLIGIANRMDLRDEVAGEASGEGRLVFGTVNGVADDPTTVIMPMTIIFEYFLAETRTPVEWANTWHALGNYPSFDEPYRAALEQVTNAFTKRGARPAGVNGSSLGQIRTNESALNWIWQLREFGLEADGTLHLRGLRNTPPRALNNTNVLRDYVVANAAAIKSNKFEMPISLRAGSADQLRFSWSLPNVEEATRKAFAQNTCNGCHSEENPSVDTVFHISPFRQGVARLSPFIHNPGKADQLTLRTAAMQRALCGAP